MNDSEASGVGRLESSLHSRGKSSVNPWLEIDCRRLSLSSFGGEGWGEEAAFALAYRWFMGRGHLCSEAQGLRARRFFRSVLFLLYLLPALLPTQSLAGADLPHWIWQDTKGAPIQTSEACYLRKKFSIQERPLKALLSVAADDEAQVYINGEHVAHPKDWSK